MKNQALNFQVGLGYLILDVHLYSHSANCTLLCTLSVELYTLISVISKCIEAFCSKSLSLLQVVAGICRLLCSPLLYTSHRVM